MTYELPPLPYATNALAPTIGTKTLEIHHGKHHAGYLTKLKTLIAGTDLDGASLQDIIKRTARDPARVAIFNNAAQAFNHEFFWESMAVPGTTSPSTNAKNAIKTSFGDMASFRKAFIDAGKEHFASGWVWAVAANNRIEIVTTANAGTPLDSGKTPLLVCDLWEHAYYLDYQQARDAFLAGFCAKLIDWNRFDARLAADSMVEKEVAA